MAFRRVAAIVFIGGAALVAAQADAEGAELGSSDSLPSVEVHAFGTQGFILTTGNNYLALDSKTGSAALSEVGLNFTKSLTDDLRFGVQLLAQFFYPSNDYTAQFSWFYVDYHRLDWLGFRAGRLRIPFGLYNEIRDIDSARVPILLPPSVYPFNVSTIGFAQTGAELYGFGRLGSAGAIEYRAYGGTFPSDVGALAGRPFVPTALDTKFVVGGRLSWETPLEGLRALASFEVFKLGYDANFPPTASGPGPIVHVSVSTAFALGSLEYAAHDLLLATEYGRWFADVDTGGSTIIPSNTPTSERGYALAAYRCTPWLQPGVYYSLLFPDVDRRGGRQNVQHDIAMTIRFDVNSYWLFKIEGHYLLGTAAFNPIGGVTVSSLNGGAPLSALQRDWAAFLIDTTGYF
jgi:hypothetical protein